ncbi:MAG: DUF433 domain-containing protein [Saprospiraceae bacterium]
MTNWNTYIVSDKDVLLGKPCVKGTRLSVEFILKLLANGWSEEQILKNYPRLSKAALQAVFAYAYECMADGLLFTFESQAA